MPFFREGVVLDVRTTGDLVTAVVELDGTRIDAVGYPDMVGEVRSGDRVVVNTTGLDLALGTGGRAFILWDLDGDGPAPSSPGHVVKMRYTPWQKDVLASEAPESPHHEVLAGATDLGGAPVVVCGLHSQLAAAAAGIKEAAPEARVGYLMTDAGALPLALSDLVRDLRRAGLLDVTCTAGHAFGGDLEAVNAYSGLLALRHAGGADAIVAGTGPGVVGTDTPFGFSALEQGPLLDAAGALGGVAIAVLRVSFDDPRPRHVPLSHHTITALTAAASRRAIAAVPKLDPQRSNELADRLRGSGICDHHEVRLADGRPALALLAERGISPTTMGRSVADSPEPFLAAGAAGRIAAGSLTDPEAAAR